MTVNDGMDQVTQEVKINFLAPMSKGPFRIEGNNIDNITLGFIFVGDDVMLEPVNGNKKLKKKKDIASFHFPTVTK